MPAKRNSLKKMVEECLRKHPETRNSDITLTRFIWRQYYPSKIVTLDDGEFAVRLRDLYELPREDAVKRHRAKFTELGQYLPTSLEVAKQRQIEERVWRNYIKLHGIEDAPSQYPPTIIKCAHGIPSNVVCPYCNQS